MKVLMAQISEMLVLYQQALVSIKVCNDLSALRNNVDLQK